MLLFVNTVSSFLSSKSKEGNHSYNHMEDLIPGQTTVQLIGNVVYDYRLFIWGFVTGVAFVTTGSLFRRK